MKLHMLPCSIFSAACGEGVLPATCASLHTSITARVIAQKLEWEQSSGIACYTGLRLVSVWYALQ